MTTKTTNQTTTMTTNLQEKIKAAIDRSESHNEIVRVTIDGDSGDALEAIGQVFDGGDFDYVMIDREGIDVLDVWGWTDDETKEAGEQDWRLAIRFNDDDEGAA